MAAIGTYQILGKLGQGAHSTILHIRRSLDGKQYALKVVPIDSKDEKKFLDQASLEFRVSKMLGHPNIIQIHEMECERNWFFQVKKATLLIEYVNGKTLDAVPRLSLPRLVQIFEKVASALVHMHRRGVYHADLKPNNLMLSRTGDVKVIDFGLAWIKGEAKDRVQGTPEYMAPEQAKNQIANERSDIYNFGATMYRLVTFRLPPSVLQPGMSGKVFAGMLKPVKEYTPTCPEGLADLIHRCLSWKPEQRPTTATVVQAELEQLVTKMVKTSADRLEGFEW